MNKERYNQIIDEVYENYKSTTLESDMKKSAWELTVQSMSGKKFIISQEEFINKCKTDSDFSEKWGLQIEERELSFEERWDLSEKYGYRKKVGEMPSETETFNGVNEREEFNSMMNDPVMGTNLPTKLITLTYNNETIENYDLVI